MLRSLRAPAWKDLGITTDFFEQLSHHFPSMRLSGPRVAAIIAAEHLLLMLRVIVDWMVPDVSDRYSSKPPPSLLLLR